MHLEERTHPTVTRPLTTYRRCNCAVNHRSYRAMARCCWPHHASIEGEGPFASVSYCQSPSVPYRTITVLLHHKEDAARKALAEIDDSACGGGCIGNHALVRLTLKQP